MALPLGVKHRVLSRGLIFDICSIFDTCQKYTGAFLTGVKNAAMLDIMKRYLEPCVKKDLAEKMVFIGGPRQVGKTTLALNVCKCI